MCVGTASFEGLNVCNGQMGTWLDELEWRGKVSWRCSVTLADPHLLCSTSMCTMKPVYSLCVGVRLAREGLSAINSLWQTLTYVGVCVRASGDLLSRKVTHVASGTLTRYSTDENVLAYFCVMWQNLFFGTVILSWTPTVWCKHRLALAETPTAHTAQPQWGGDHLPPLKLSV